MAGSTVLILPGPTLTVVCLKDFTKVKLKTKDFFAKYRADYMVSFWGKAKKKNVDKVLEVLYLRHYLY